MFLNAATPIFLLINYFVIESLGRSICKTGLALKLLSYGVIVRPPISSFVIFAWRADVSNVRLIEEFPSFSVSTEASRILYLVPQS